MRGKFKKDVVSVHQCLITLLLVLSLSSVLTANPSPADDGFLVPIPGYNSIKLDIADIEEEVDALEKKETRTTRDKKEGINEDPTEEEKSEEEDTDSEEGDENIEQSEGSSELSELEDWMNKYEPMYSSEEMKNIKNEIQKVKSEKSLGKKLLEQFNKVKDQAAVKLKKGEAVSTKQKKSTKDKGKPTKKKEVMKKAEAIKLLTSGRAESLYKKGIEVSGGDVYTGVEVAQKHRKLLSSLIDSKSVSKALYKLYDKNPDVKKQAVVQIYKNQKKIESILKENSINKSKFQKALRDRNIDEIQRILKQIIHSGSKKKKKSEKAKQIEEELKN